MSRIRDTFAELKHSGRGGFIPFITAGDPDLETTELLLVELAAAGADIIELGVPFSDPVADGEVIQRASERALGKGVTLSEALRCVSNAKAHVDIPIVLFSYLNPLLKFGKDRLAEDAKRAGVDAVLITDLTPEEAGPWIRALRGREIDLIFLVAPTTSDERLTRIVRNEVPRDAEPLVKRVRAVSDLPVAVGFGISTAEQVRQVWRFADAAVIGSAIVSEIEKLADSRELVNHISQFARLLLPARRVGGKLVG